jgi:hypothetical protein
MERTAIRASFRVLTISGALLLAAALAPAMAQTDSAPQNSGTNATPPPAPGEPSGEAPKDAGAAQDAGAAKEASPNTPPDAGSSPGASGADSAKGAAAAQDPNAPQFAHGDDSTSADHGATPSAIPEADMKKAFSILRRATRDYVPCTHSKSCLAYFDSFGVGFTFADGTLAAFVHEQRLQISGHDCVLNARNALSRGDRSMAVQWMMAAQLDILNRNWIGDHPDAMVEALRTFRGWA